MHKVSCASSSASCHLFRNGMDTYDVVDTTLVQVLLLLAGMDILAGIRTPLAWDAIFSLGVGYGLVSFLFKDAMVLKVGPCTVPCLAQRALAVTALCRPALCGHCVVSCSALIRKPAPTLPLCCCLRSFLVLPVLSSRWALGGCDTAS